MNIHKFGEQQKRSQHHFEQWVVHMFEYLANTCDDGPISVVDFNPLSSK